MVSSMLFSLDLKLRVEVVRPPVNPILFHQFWLLFAGTLTGHLLLSPCFQLIRPSTSLGFHLCLLLMLWAPRKRLLSQLVEADVEVEVEEVAVAEVMPMVPI